MADNNGRSSKPCVLILGGVGFIGRNLVHYLVSNDLVEKVRVADKVMPQMAWLNDDHKKAFAQVEFKHANLITLKSVASVFQTEDGKPFDFVINCAAETKYGQTESVYRDGVYKLSMNCAEEAERHQVKRYIEISTSQVTTSNKRPLTDQSCCEAWTQVGRQKLAVESTISNIKGLDYVILRPAIVYGPGDRAGLTPRLVVGGVYKYLQEKMQMLWTPTLKVNTVHVRDVCQAIWHLCNHGRRGDIYCLADKGDTTQGKVGELISELFNINHDYIGSLVSTIAKDDTELNLADIVDEINDKHMSPWGEACQRDGVVNTPLNPYLEEELLAEKDVYVDGSGIEQSGFRYDHPYINLTLLKEVLDDYVKMGLFPASLAHVS